MKTSVTRKIPYGKQSISAADVQAVVDVLSSDWLTQGPVIEQFEQAIAKYCGAQHAVAVSNATAGLHIACMALGLGPGDRLWTSPNTFVASANCALYCGAEVDFVDIDPDTLNMSVSALTTKLEAAEKSGTLPKVVVPVHFGGQSCDMRSIKQLADQFGFFIIEDASHAIGGRYEEQPIGSCKFSDMTVFSFHPVKIITTGEGGMVLTNEPALQEKLARLRTHGITRDPKQMPGPIEGPWQYQQIELGYNYRITNIQAALGLSQMARLDDFVARRHALAETYKNALRDLPIAYQQQRSDCYSAYHLFVIKLLRNAGISRLDLFERMRAAGILVNVHYIPVHLQPYYRRLGFQDGAFPESEHYYAAALTLPLFYDFTVDDQRHVTDTLTLHLTCRQP